jgi:hypothetical protein
LLKRGSNLPDSFWCVGTLEQAQGNNMNQTLFQFSRRFASVGIAALLSFGCSADAGQPPSPEQPAPEVGVSSESLIVGVWVTKTHWVGFYQLETGSVLVLERHNMDEDKPLLAGKRVHPGQYAETYKLVAASRVDGAALARLEALDTTMKNGASANSEPSNVDDEVGEADLTPMPKDQLVSKDFVDDMEWCSNNSCKGCMGLNGQQEGWEWKPVCTTSPEVCSATFQSGYVRRKSKNMYSEVSNFGYGPALYKVLTNDTCENTNWWNRTFAPTCNRVGKIEGQIDLPPRTTAWATITNTKSWTRNYIVEGPAFIALMIDTYDTFVRP